VFYNDVDNDVDNDVNGQCEVLARLSPRRKDT
jgi:hypothetical protein